MREDLAKNLYEKADNTQFIGFLNFIVHEFKGPFIVSSGNDDSAFWSISFTFNDTSLVVSSHLETIVDYLFNRRSIDHASVNAQYLVEIPLEKNGEFTYIVYEGAKYLLKHDRFELNNCSL